MKNFPVKDKLKGKEREVIRLYRQGESTTAIAKTFAVCQAAIWYLLNRRGIKCRNVGARKGERRSPETEFKKGQISWNKGKGMSLEQKKEARRKAWAKFNNKPERKAFMRSYDTRYGRYSINEGYWKWLCEFLDYRCQYCGYQFSFRKLEIDHIVPVSKGGTSDWHNIQPLCRSCNSNKKDNDFVISNAMRTAQYSYLKLNAKNN